MNVLIVYAHHEPSSFNGAMLACAQHALRAAGHSVAISDLHAMRFDPVSDRRNFTTIADPRRLQQQTEEKHAARADGFAADVRAEIDKVERADLLILQFPLWWLGMPAILKGWIDRVFACGVVYGGGRYFDSGLMKGRRALCVVTVGGSDEDYRASGRYAMSMDAVLAPIHRGVFEFTGYEALPAFIAHAPSRLSEAARRDLLAGLQRRLLELAA
jgi:NAD(P)H dehydrogenase (quinone)